MPSKWRDPIKYFKSPRGLEDERFKDISHLCLVAKLQLTMARPMLQPNHHDDPLVS